MESKRDIYKILPEGYFPLTIYFEAGASEDEILNKVLSKELKFPLIGKPDIGMKGMSVKKMNDINELIQYAAHSKVNFLIQEFIPLKNEVGIFYYRFPNETKGRISGIVGKEFLSVKGDGRSTIMELLKRDKRYILQIPVLKKTYGKRLAEILNREEEFVLVPYGNHVRGAKFIDCSDRIDEALTNAIDSVCKQVNGFYYGRLDVRYNSWEELREGKNFSVIELNGAGSEPTHMYDPKHSILFAWKEIIRHWNILWKISRINHHKEKRPYMKLKAGIAMLKESKAYIKMIAGEH